MANPNPNTSGLRPPWEPGQSGNPGGLTKEVRAMIAENAEKATRLRARFLDALLHKVGKDEISEADVDAILDRLAGDALKLMKDAEDRGFGAPKTTAEIDANVNGDVKSEITVTFVDAKPDPDA